MDDPVALLFAVIIPASLWVAYLYYQDRLKPEPLHLVGLSFILGIGSAFLCVKLFDLLHDLGVGDPLTTARGDDDAMAFLPYALAVIGPVEELCKLLPFALVCVRLQEFDETIDGIVYSSAVALGFASYENILFMDVLSGAEYYGHALAAPLVHSLFSSMWGYAYARAHMAGRSAVLPTLVMFVLSALLHGLYDFLTLHPLLTSLSVVAIGGLWFWRLSTIKGLQRVEAETTRAATAERAGGDGAGGEP